MLKVCAACFQTLQPGGDPDDDAVLVVKPG
jgi:hypothetical protein